MTDTLPAPMSDASTRHAFGWHLAPTGDLWELTEEGWYSNGNWVGRDEDIDVPAGMQRLLTGNQWARRVQQSTQRNMGRPLSSDGVQILRECMRDELFPEEDTWVEDNETFPASSRSPQQGVGFAEAASEVMVEQSTPAQVAPPARQRGFFRRG